MEVLDVEANGGYGQAVADEVFLQLDRLGHGLAELLFKVVRPDLRVLCNEFTEQVAQELDVIGFITQGVAEHLADARELVLTVEAENHTEETVELGSLHALTEDEDVAGEGLFVFSQRHVHVATQRAGVRDDEVGLFLHGLHAFKDGLTLVRVKPREETM